MYEEKIGVATIRHEEKAKNYGVDGVLKEYYENAIVEVGGKIVLSYVDVYKNISCGDYRNDADHYTCIAYKDGIFGGEHILIIENNTARIYDLSVEKYLGRKSPKNELIDASIHANSIVIASMMHAGKIYPKKIFAKDLTAGRKKDLGNDKRVLSNLFTYEVLPDMGILVRLKKDITREDLMRFHGFGLAYDAFKIWDLDKNTKQMYLMSVEDRKQFYVKWGKETTCTNENIWEMRDELMDCIKQAFPNHPAYREELYGEQLT